MKLDYDEKIKHMIIDGKGCFIYGLNNPAFNITKNFIDEMDRNENHLTLQNVYMLNNTKNNFISKLLDSIRVLKWVWCNRP